MFRPADDADLRHEQGNEIILAQTHLIPLDLSGESDLPKLVGNSHLPQRPTGWIRRGTRDLFDGIILGVVGQFGRGTERPESTFRKGIETKRAAIAKNSVLLIGRAARFDRKSS